MSGAADGAERPAPYTSGLSAFSAAWAALSVLALGVALSGYLGSPESGLDDPHLYFQGTDASVKGVVLASLNLFSALLLLRRRRQVIAVLLVLFLARLAFAMESFQLHLSAEAFFAALLYGYTSILWLPMFGYAVYLKRVSVLR